MGREAADGGARRLAPAGGASVLALLVALAAPPAGPAAADEDAPFETVRLEASGRPLHARVVTSPDGRDVLVVYVEGMPPDERRRLALFRAASGEPKLAPRLWLDVPPDAVAFDVGDVHPEPGEELLLLSRNAVEVRALRAGAPLLHRLALDPPAPLPPRVRSFSPMPLLEDAGPGATLLLPSLDGARRIALDGSRDQQIDMPILTEYFTPHRGPPPYDGLMEVTFEWPSIARGDDDGDGREDLFALGRYGVSVFRADESGIPDEATRTMPLRPFQPDEELRYEGTRARLFARDLDGDGRTDLVVHRSSGRLFGSNAMTQIHHNTGDGANLARTADARLAVSSGVADLELVDLDGDGRVEVLHTVLRFGVGQLLRFLTTRRAEVEMRVFTLGAPGIQGAHEVWLEEVPLPVNLEEGRVAGLLPDARGDWNGDGRNDLLYSTGRESIALHLGQAVEKGPGFGDRVAEVDVPGASWMEVLDADGDGLDDMVVWDDWVSDGGAHLLLNRRQLPGTRPALRPRE